MASRKLVTKKRAKPKRKPADDFVSVARRIGADEDKGRFEVALGRIARAKPITPAKGRGA
jgi:hypothetical protein